MKIILVLLVLFMSLPIWGMTEEQFENNDFKLISRINTVEDFSNIYDVSEDLSQNFLDYLSEVGMGLDDLDNYITYLGYTVLISDEKASFKNYSFLEIKKLILRNLLTTRHKIKFLITRVITNQDEILAFNSITKSEFRDIIFYSKDTITEYKEKIKFNKDKEFSNINLLNFKKYQDLIRFIQNKAISVIKNRWEHKFDNKEFENYYRYGELLNLDLELISQTISRNNIEHENTYEYLQEFSGTSQNLRSFMLPKRALKELSRRANQMFFNKFERGDILTMELDHDGNWYKDLDELLRGYYNHTTLVVKDAYVDLDYEYVNPIENIFFSADRSKPDGVDFEQRSKYQYTYISHETPGNHDLKWFQYPEPWEMVRSYVKHYEDSNNYFIAPLIKACEDASPVLDFLDFFGLSVDCPEMPISVRYTDEEINDIVDYAISLRGKPYSVIPDSDGLYCSQVTWKAYKEAGKIDLDSSMDITVKHVDPDNIVDSPYTYEEDYWDYRDEKRTVLGVCKYRNIIDVELEDNSRESINEILRNGDLRSYYNCSDTMKNKVKEAVRNTNYEEFWINEDKDEDSINDNIIPTMKLCKQEKYSKTHSDICFALAVDLYIMQKLKPWLIEKPTTCYVTESSHERPNYYNNKLPFMDLGEEYKKACIDNFDFVNTCKYSTHLATEIKPDFLDEDFINNLGEALLFNPNEDPELESSCNYCFNEAKKLRNKCPDFINYYTKMEEE